VDGRDRVADERARGRADHVAALARRRVLDGPDRALAVAQSVKWGKKGESS